MLRRFVLVFLRHMIFITSHLSLLSLLLLHLLSSLLSSSPLRGLPLWSFPLCLVLLSSLFSVMCCHCFCCCFVAAASAVAARVAAVGAAGGSCVFLSGCFSFRVSLFSLSFRPLLSSCQVHSAWRVACTAENHARCVHCGQTGRWRASRRRSSSCVEVRQTNLKLWRTSEVSAVTETKRQTLRVLRRHSSLDMSRSTLWRDLHEDLQARSSPSVHRD